MKKAGCLVLSLLLSVIARASDVDMAAYENEAKETLGNFIMAVGNNSGGINIESNWNKLVAATSEFTTPEFLRTFLNIETNQEFNRSLLSILMVKNEMQTWILLHAKEPYVLSADHSGDQAAFKIKLYKTSMPTFTVKCQKIIKTGIIWDSEEIKCLVADMTSEKVN